MVNKRHVIYLWVKWRWDINKTLTYKQHIIMIKKLNIIHKIKYNVPS
jgi:hypothetical protein